MRFQFAVVVGIILFAVVAWLAYISLSAFFTPNQMLNIQRNQCALQTQQMLANAANTIQTKLIFNSPLIKFVEFRTPPVSFPCSREFLDNAELSLQSSNKDFCISELGIDGQCFELKFQTKEFSTRSYFAVPYGVAVCQNLNVSFGRYKIIFDGNNFCLQRT